MDLERFLKETLKKHPGQNTNDVLETVHCESPDEICGNVFGEITG